MASKTSQRVACETLISELSAAPYGRFPVLVDVLNIFQRAKVENELPGVNLAHKMLDMAYQWIL